MDASQKLEVHMHKNITIFFAHAISLKQIRKAAGAVILSSKIGSRLYFCLHRCGLSPSPATGLVGLEENTFLSDYFRVGFMPFTTQRYNSYSGKRSGVENEGIFR